jgi:signal transduction histidine kinase
VSVKGSAPSFVPDARTSIHSPQQSSELGHDLVAAVLDVLPIGVYVASAQGAALYRNRTATTLLGRRFKPGTPITSLSERHAIHRADSDELYPSELLPIVRATHGETCVAHDLEIRAHTPPTRVTMWATPLFDRSGQLVLVASTLTENTPSTGGQLTGAPSSTDSFAPSSHARLTRNFEIIGQLAAGVAHEINTPMQYIGDNTAFLGTTIRRLLELANSFELLLAACRSGMPVSEQMVADAEGQLRRQRLPFLREQAPTAIEQTTAGIDQVRAIVQALKEFSHPGEDRPMEVDVNHLVEMATTVTRNTWRYIANLNLELGSPLRPVRVYPQELGQVFINLIVNAAHAIEERRTTEGGSELGTISIVTRSTSEHVEISVTDDGGGIPDAIRNQIMAPFFTTKPVGKGTGQGLPFARRVIVDRHAGSLSFESQVGAGTTFLIVLPGADDER